jgi:indolepyruvate ferredoxin oxidoreductase, beta subunit
MSTTNILLCGLGGQGILFMTKLLAQAAMDKGLRVMGAETHGMAQRGGSVVSHLRLGEVKGSLIRAGTADYLLALEENEAYRNLSFLRRGGSMYVNANPGNFPKENVRVYLEDHGIMYHCFSATQTAVEMGAPKSVNLALLGFFTGFNGGAISYKELKETIDSISPEKLRASNINIFNAGFSKADNK